MRKIALSLLTLVATAAVLGGATSAYFFDTELSDDNVFQAGQLDLRIDSTAHYNGMVCAEVSPGIYQWQEETTGSSEMPELLNTTCTGSWDLSDLDDSHRFFYYEDIKPGDFGENTVSIHVDDNDAWLRVTIDDLYNTEHGCTEPESQQDGSCDNPGLGQGELAANMYFWAWTDEGAVDGWQCPADEPACDADPTEGDNVWQIADEPELMARTSGAGILPAGVQWDLGQVNGGEVAYIGVGWEVPADVENEIQGDEFSGDITFDVVQVRHNDTPVWPQDLP